MNIVTIFVDTARPTTTGTHLHDALLKLDHQVSHVNPLTDGVKKGADLYVMVDDGIPYEIKESFGRLAYWAIDTHISMDQQIEKSKHADFVFAAQKNGAEQLAQKIGRPVTWLPLACDPVIHKPYEEEEVFDVSFIGNVIPKLMPDRVEYLDRLFREFPNFDFGQSWEEEMSKRLCQSKIIFNKAIRDDVNMRVFEAIATGKLLVTDDVQSIQELFADKQHLVLYRTQDEMVNVIRYYLEHEQQRNEIAQKGMEEILAKHTYQHRAQKVLDTVFKK